MLIKLQLSRSVCQFSSCVFVTTFFASEFYKLLLISAILQMQYSSLQVWNFTFIELSFAQIWSLCRRKTTIAEILTGGVKYIHKKKHNCLHCTNAGTMSPGPSQGPAHTGTAGFSQPTGTSSKHHRGRGPLPKGAQLKLGITGTDNNGTGILRPPRFLYNGAKTH